MQKNQRFSVKLGHNWEHKNLRNIFGKKFIVFFYKKLFDNQFNISMPKSVPY